MKKLIYLFGFLLFFAVVLPIPLRAGKATGKFKKMADPTAIGSFSQNGNSYILYGDTEALRVSYVIDVNTNVQTVANGPFRPNNRTTTFTYNPTGSLVIIYSGSY